MLNSKWDCWLLLIVSKIRYNVMRMLMYSVIHTFIQYFICSKVIVENTK